MNVGNNVSHILVSMFLVSSFAKISQLKVVGVLCFQSAISRFSLFNAREIDLTFSVSYYLEFPVFVHPCY